MRGRAPTTKERLAYAIADAEKHEARAEKAERERDAFAKLAHTYTDENNEHMRHIAELERERDEALKASLPDA